MLSINWQRVVYAACLASHGALFELSQAGVISGSAGILIGSLATFIAGVLTVLRPGQRVPGLSRSA